MKNTKDVTWLVCESLVGKPNYLHFAETMTVCDDREILAVAARFPAVTCYRDKDESPALSYHYWITGYTHHTDGSVTLRALNDGNDEVLPGIGCARIPPNSLRPCGCKKWVLPTKAQCERSGVTMLDFIAKRGRA